MRMWVQCIREVAVTKMMRAMIWAMEFRFLWRKGRLRGSGKESEFLGGLLVGGKRGREDRVSLLGMMIDITLLLMDSFHFYYLSLSREKNETCLAVSTTELSYEFKHKF